MISFTQKLKTLCLLLITSWSLGAVDTIPKPYYQISLLTIAPGSEIYSLFGHTAIRVKDLKSEEDITYNYGTFDFRTPNFMVKFLRGKLLYQLSKAPFYAFMYEYNEIKRSVVEQVLDITQEEATEIYSFLENNALPENKDYLYDFLYDNCTTRARDIFNNHLKMSIDDEDVVNKTFRQMLHEYLTPYPWTKFGIDLIVASRADKKTDAQTQMFLPDYLETQMAKATQDSVENKRFIFMPSRQLIYFDKADSSLHMFTPFNIFLGLALLLILLYFTKFKAAAYSVMTLLFVILGIGSMVLAFMWFATDHYTTKINYNLLWMSPLYLLLPFLPKKSNIIVSGLLIFITLLCVTPWLPQVMPVKSILSLVLTILGLNIYFQLVDREEERVFIEE
ncbi:MAG TPA: DUF4105 domain-containing protein [Saprospiraceae bacterium]|nr:DUF4105 domain-containing protein [Saprospiraceae bacterium]